MMITAKRNVCSAAGTPPPSIWLVTDRLIALFVFFVQLLRAYLTSSV